MTTSNARRRHFREWRRETLWLWPAVAAAVAWVGARLVVDHSPVFVVRDHLFSTNIDDARAVLGTVATSILTFTGVVFSITLVALQMASSQYSPRVLRTFVRKPVTKIALSVFIATFVYALAVLASLDRRHGPNGVPAGAVAIAYLLALASVLVFVVFVHSTVRSMRVTYVLQAVADEASGAFASAFTDSAPAGVGAREVERPRLITFDHPDRVLAGIDVPGLVNLARRHDCWLLLQVDVGAYIIRGAPLSEVHGDGGPTVTEVLACLDLAAVRTLYQDPSYGMRQLVDIAIRALSPAVNDPTTAVQSIDRLAGLLTSVAAQPDPTGMYADSAGVVRVVRPVRTWGQLVDLAFTEIGQYGATSSQVSRKLMSVYAGLQTRVGPGRQCDVTRHRDWLEREIAHRIPDAETRGWSLHPDALGLG